MMEGVRVSDSAPRLLPEAIYSALRKSIIDQSFAPGEALTESAVALRFAVTRPTAKIAIERLVAEGLLRRESHSAARIPVLLHDDVADLYDNRAVVEAAAIAALARSSAVPAEAMSAHRALLANAANDEPFAEHDIAFHRALVAGQPSPRLERLHSLLMGEIELCIGQVQAARLMNASAVAEEHQAILDAIVAGDTDLAVARITDHIHHSRDVMLARFTNQDLQ
jgi:DNA-binding GntR family transcriptional regulator